MASRRKRSRETDRESTGTLLPARSLFLGRDGVRVVNSPEFGLPHRERRRLARQEDRIGTREHAAENAVSFAHRTRDLESMTFEGQCSDENDRVPQLDDTGVLGQRADEDIAAGFRHGGSKLVRTARSRHPDAKWQTPLRASTSNLNPRRRKSRGVSRPIVSACLQRATRSSSLPRPRSRPISPVS